MIRKLDQERLSAELNALEMLLNELGATDYLSRVGLEARREELRESLARLGQTDDTQARIALFFGGNPVIGSEAVVARFAAEAVGSFQDILTNVWGLAQEKPVAIAGPIRNQELSQLHITHMLYGSVGFLLEELDPNGQPLFDSSLKTAAEEITKVLSGFADEDDSKFTETIQELSPRVFASVLKFFRCVHTDDATFRVVEGEVDLQVNREGVERAWRRAEQSRVDEERLAIGGRLLGVIPIHRRFEFQPDEGPLISGIVGQDFSQSYLERMNTEQFAGKRWRGFFHRKLIEKVGRPLSPRYTLLRLDSENAEPPAGIDNPAQR